MEKLQQEPAQLNNEPAEKFSLEDIMAEFGSEGGSVSALPEKEPAKEASAPAAPPKATETKPPKAKKPPRPPKEKKQKKSPASPEPEEVLKVWTPKARQLPEEPRPVQEETPVTFHRPKVLPKPENREPTPQQELQRLQEQIRGRKGAVIALWICTALTILAAAALSLPMLSLGEKIPADLRNLGFLGLFLLEIFLSLPDLITGLRSLLGKKFTLHTMVSITVLSSLLQTCFHITGSGLPLSIPAELVLTVAVWSRWQGISARICSLEAIVSMPEPMAAALKAAGWKDKDCICRTPADLRHVTEQSRSHSPAEKTAGILCPILTVLALVTALIFALRGKRDFLQVFSTILLGSVPLGCGLAYHRSFLLLSRRLSACHAAVAGWCGAEELSSKAAAILLDRDLFPAKKIRLNGLKTLAELPAEEVLAYAALLLNQAGAPVGQVLRAAMGDNGSRRTVESFTIHIAGIGGTVENKQLLLGSLECMSRRSVIVPADSRLNSALYLAVNGRAVGMLMLKYQPTAATQAALASLNASPGLSLLLATRDITLTPLFLESTFGISRDRFLFPDGLARQGLSYPPENRGLIPGAYLGRDSFFSFASAIAGSRRLCRSTRSAARVAVFAAILGYCFMALLCLLGASEVASAVNILLYQGIWLLPALLITGLLGK